MRYLGKGSVASFLAVVLRVVWYICLVAAIGLVIGLPVVSTLPESVFTKGSYSFNTGILSLDLKVAGQDIRHISLGVMAYALVSVCFALAVISQLRRLFCSLSAETPFTMANAKRIRAIGWLTIAGSLAQGIMTSILGVIMMNIIRIPNINVTGNLNLNPNGVFAGLIILVLAEVFKHGAALQEEQNLTV